MDNLVMKRCCCSCGTSVRKCSTVVAVLSVIFGMVHVVTVLSTAINRGSLDELHGLVENLFGLLEKHITASLVLLLATIHAFFAILLIFLSILLLVGVLMEKKKMLLPWLIVNGCQIVAITYSSFVFMTLFPGFMALLWIVSVPFPAYGYVVVLSYYFQLSEEE